MANKYHRDTMAAQKSERQALRERGIRNIGDDPRARTPAVYNRDVKRFLKKTRER